MNTVAMTTQKNNTSRLSRLGLVGLLAVGLAACAPTFKADVSRFQTQLPAPQGQTFAVVAEDPALAGGVVLTTITDVVGFFAFLGLAAYFYR